MVCGDIEPKVPNCGVYWTRDEIDGTAIPTAATEGGALGYDSAN